MLPDVAVGELIFNIGIGGSQRAIIFGSVTLLFALLVTHRFSSLWHVYLQTNKKSFSFLFFLYQMNLPLYFSSYLPHPQENVYKIILGCAEIK